MNKRQKTTTKVGMILLIFAGMAIALLPLQVWAAVDTDQDGILDSTSGVPGDGDCLPIGSVCSDTGINPKTKIDTPDLFVILARPIGSILNQYKNYDPLDFIRGTGVVKPFTLTLHEISFLDAPLPGLKVTNEQKAIALIEDLSTSSGALGVSQIGVPAQGRSGRVYTNRIRNDIVKACSLQDPTLCQAVNSAAVVKATGMDQIFPFYAKNVVSHEIFHMVNRVVPAINADNHYPQLGYIMDNHMVYKVYNTKKKVVWTITDQWSPADNKPLFK
jgi:hypothetical protein